MKNQQEKGETKPLSLVEEEVGIAETAAGLVEYKKMGRAPYMLVSHGTPGGFNQSADSACFLEAGIGIITPSRPGYLGTPLSSGASLADQADAFAALLDTLGIDQAAVHGTSGGGPPAIHFAARHPDRIKALMLTSSLIKRHKVEMPGWSSILLTSPLMNRLLAWVFTSFPKTLIKSALQIESTYGPAQREKEANRIVNDPEVLAIMQELLLSNLLTKEHLPGFENDLRTWEVMESLPLEAVKCPTLITHGTADKDITIDHAEEAYQGIPGAELYRMKDAWHVVWVDEAADEMLNKQVAFLKAQFEK